MSVTQRPTPEQVQTSLVDLLADLIETDEFLEHFPDIELGEDGLPVEGAASIHEYTHCSDGLGLRVVLNVKLPGKDELQKYEVFCCAHPGSPECEELTDTAEEMDAHVKAHANDAIDKDESISSSENGDDMDVDEHVESQGSSGEEMDVASTDSNEAKQRPFKCAKCGFRFTQRWSLTRHLQSKSCFKGMGPRGKSSTTSAEKGPECSYCGMKFVFAKDKIRHALKDCNKRPEANNKIKTSTMKEYKCPHCGRTYKGKRWLSRHIRNDCMKISEDDMKLHSILSSVISGTNMVIWSYEGTN